MYDFVILRQCEGAIRVNILCADCSLFKADLCSIDVNCLSCYLYSMCNRVQVLYEFVEEKNHGELLL